MDIVNDNFDLADHFPARDLSNDSKSLPLNDEHLVTKRFVFDKKALMVLKKEGASSLVMNPSKVEVVSAFIWKHCLELAKCKDTCSSAKLLPLSVMVNLRKKMKDCSHSLENVFGNCFVISTAFCNIRSIDDSCLYQDLVSKLMRSSITKIDEDYIAKAQIGDRYLNDRREFSSMVANGEISEWFVVSSWCKFPTYKVDFGWGNPTWVCTTALPRKGLVVLIDTKCGNGVEAWICLEADKLKSLETKIQLIYAN